MIKNRTEMNVVTLDSTGSSNIRTPQIYDTWSKMIGLGRKVRTILSRNDDHHNITLNHYTSHFCNQMKQ